MKEVTMSKQTAVEWLFEQCPRINTVASLDVIDQAKAMEKEQIVEAYDNGYDLRDDMGSLSSNPRGEQYYNETYGGQDV
jgi:hypothetical protein